MKKTNRDGYSDALILRPEWRASYPRVDVVIEKNHKSKLVRVNNKIVRKIND